MSALLLQIHVIAVILYRTIDAQPEESFYSFGFEQQSSYWVENTGSYDPSVHTFIPIVWYQGGNCPRAAAGESAEDAYRCMHASKDAYISRTISTSGYHSIRLEIDVAAISVEPSNGDWCIMQYRTASTTWINDNIIQGADNYVLDYNVYIPDNNVYNNQESFKVKIGIAANAGGDNCYFDNFQVFGVPYTQQPTSDTSDPTINPSVSPTFLPTLYPSEHPTIYPSVPPTNRPTSVPFVFTTIEPSGSPTNKPTYVPFVSPVIHSTTNIIDASSGARNKDGVETIYIMIGIVSFLSVLVIIVVIKNRVSNKSQPEPQTIPGENEKGDTLETDTENITLWLKHTVMLPEYHDIFIQNGFENIKFIMKIEDASQLNELGITKKGHQIRIMAEIQRLQYIDRFNEEGFKTKGAEKDIKSEKKHKQNVPNIVRVISDSSSAQKTEKVQNEGPPQVQCTKGDESASEHTNIASDEFIVDDDFIVE